MGTNLPALCRIPKRQQFDMRLFAIYIYDIWINVGIALRDSPYKLMPDAGCRSEEFHENQPTWKVAEGSLLGPGNSGRRSFGRFQKRGFVLVVS